MFYLGRRGDSFLKRQGMDTDKLMSIEIARLQSKNHSMLAGSGRNSLTSSPWIAKATQGRTSSPKFAFGKPQSNEFSVGCLWQPRVEQVLPSLPSANFLGPWFFHWDSWGTHPWYTGGKNWFYPRENL